MKQAKYGLILYLFMILPPVSSLLESIMIVHMHMQMPLLIISGFLMAPYFLQKCPKFFEKWNQNGIPGILLFIIIVSYWMLPRAMDEALTIPFVEAFKFFSLPFLAGIPLRDSWKKLHSIGKDITFVYFILTFVILGWIYVAVDEQICNNYLMIEQKTLGWGSLATAAILIIYLLQLIFFDHSEFE
ncbi:hypothetical protein HNQ94_002505 [Salirhabdus euzebyi]|uniref:Uncharacterized protein n=1 Tax=Salirhabdus euzebyi TaxID=394506 RepID=A0A841Q6S5_9BACI|nr:hypothetical protein [Salirhabdus euzebyi]MBB6454054.1 hypothetical protein [Salirhabdus euzebyi]